MKLTTPTFKTAQTYAASCISLIHLLLDRALSTDVLPTKIEGMFPLAACKKEVDDTYASELTCLMGTAMDLLYNISQIGSMQNVKSLGDDILRLLETKGIADNHLSQKHYIWAQGLLNDYISSSLSIGCIIGWINTKQLTLEDVSIMLSYTYRIATYAVYSPHICFSLVAVLLPIDLNFKPEFQSANLAHTFVHNIQNNISYVKDRYLSSLVEEIQKGSWAWWLACINSLPETSPCVIDFSRTLKDIKQVVWPPILECLSGGIKYKRFICEAVQPFGSRAPLAVKEVNAIIRNEIQPLTLSILREAQSIINVTIPDIDTRLDESRQTIELTMLRNNNDLVKNTAERQLHNSNTELAKIKQKLCSETAKVKELQQQNKSLAVELHQKMLLLEKSDSSIITRLQKQIVDYQQQIKTLQSAQSIKRDEAVLQDVTKKLQDSERQIAMLKRQYDELAHQYQLLSEELVEIVEQQQRTLEIEEYNPEAHSLTVNELELLSKIHVHGIIPDLKSLKKLKDIMPCSRLVEVGQNCRLSADIQPGYDLYFFVTSLSGHKVYNKWRSYVDRFDCVKLHCSVTGINTIARQILKAYIEHYSADIKE